MYWYWYFIYNSVEIYWKGLFFYDMEFNFIYFEVKEVVVEFEEFSLALVNFKKDNEVVIYFSNEVFIFFKEFVFSKQMDYNDIVCNWYEIFYKMNVEVDFVDYIVDDLSWYKLLFVFLFYIVFDVEFEKFNVYVENGGYIFYGFKSGFMDEYVQVYMEWQFVMFREILGFFYQQFIGIDCLLLKNDLFGVGELDNYVFIWVELLIFEGVEVLGCYDYFYWGRYVCII